MPNVNGFDKNWHIPKWEENRKWKKMHERYPSSEGKVFKTYEELRDYCYGFVSNQETKYSKCNTTYGWCVPCVINKSWYRQ